MIYRVAYPASLIFDVETPNGITLTDTQVKQLAVKVVEDSGLEDGIDVPLDLMRIGTRFYADSRVRLHQLEITDRREEE